MKYFRIIVTAVVCLAFLVFAFLVRDDFVTEKIQTELLQHSITEYRDGASVYIAENDNNSKVYFGKIGSSKIYGIGALTFDKRNGVFTSGLRIESDNENIELPEISDALAVLSSSDSKYLASVSIDGSLSIYDLSTNEKTYTTPDNVNVDIRNPFEFGNLTPTPFVYYVDGKFVFSMIESEEILWGIPQKVNTEVVLVDPTNGETISLFEDEYKDFIFEIMAKFDKENILVHMKPSDLNSLISPDIALVNISSESLVKLNCQMENIIGYSSRTKSVYYNENGDIFGKRVFSDSLSDDKKRIKIKTKNTEDNDLISLNTRITSAGYLFQQTPNGFDNNILLDPKTEIHILLDKQRIPY